MVLKGTYWGTHWEQKQQCVSPAPDPKENKIGPSYLYAELSHGFHEFFISKTGLMQNMGSIGDF